MRKYLTKWDYLHDDQRAGLELTQFNHPCSGCGVMLATEADFAKHFIIKDSLYLNLGECPNQILNGDANTRESAGYGGYYGLRCLTCDETFKTLEVADSHRHTNLPSWYHYVITIVD